MTTLVRKIAKKVFFKPASTQAAILWQIFEEPSLCFQRKKCKNPM